MKCLFRNLRCLELKQHAWPCALQRLHALYQRELCASPARARGCSGRHARFQRHCQGGDPPLADCVGQSWPSLCVSFPVLLMACSRRSDEDIVGRGTARLWEVATHIPCVNGVYPKGALLQFIPQLRFARLKYIEDSLKFPTGYQRTHECSHLLWCNRLFGQLLKWEPLLRRQRLSGGRCRVRTRQSTTAAQLLCARRRGAGEISRVLTQNPGEVEFLKRGPLQVCLAWAWLSLEPSKKGRVASAMRQPCCGSRQPM